MKDPEVIVVGAGIAGLVAATEIVRAGKEVRVLEARDRVGGRTLSEVIDGEVVDLGGQWLGPGHARMHKLAKELGVETFPTFSTGRKVIEVGGKVKTYAGTIPSIGLLGLIELQRAISTVEKMRVEVDLERPWDVRRAAEWDGITVESWARGRLRTRGARASFDAAVRTIFGAEAAELSLLFFLHYLQSSGGLMHLVEIERGAQERRLVGGAQTIAKRLAARLSARLVLSSPVRAVEQDGEGVTVRCDGSEHRGRRLVLALPPMLAGRIGYAPSLPVARDQLTQRMAMGTTVKCILKYREAFWRVRGLSGEAVSDRGPPSVVFDDSSHDGKRASLLAFVVGAPARRFGEMKLEERRAAVVEALVRLFGKEAAEAEGYVDKDWSTEEWTRGCPISIMGPAVMTGFGKALREPVGRIHFAGTETATEWCGYMEGAAASGERVAREIVEAR